MIQEILDYLLIRCLLLNSTSKEIIEKIQDKETFYYIIDSIYKLMQEENFVFALSEYNNKTSDVVNSYRFNYNKDKELNDKINYIIGRLQEFRSMSKGRKKDVIDNWIQEESQSRNLPKCYQNIQNLVDLVSLDIAYFQGMITVDEPFIVESVVEYVSLINIIINKYPECFNEDHLFLEVVRHNLVYLQSIPLIRSRDLNMIKKTLRTLNQNYDINEEIELDINKSLKKTKK